MTGSIRPAPPDGGASLEQVIPALKVSRHQAGKDRCLAALRKIRGTLKSVAGAHTPLGPSPARRPGPAADQP